MKKILELREKRAKAWEAAKAFLDSKRGEDGLLSAEDTAAYERMEQEVVDLGKEIERLERQAAIDAELNRPTSEPIVNKPNNDPEGDGKKGRASDKYRRTFWNAMRRKSFYDVENALQVGTDSEGGYLVPDEFEHTLVEALEEENFFRGIATVIQTSSGDRKIPVVATKGTASWIDEEGAYPESDDSFGQVSIGAYKVATMLKVSDELLNDSPYSSSFPGTFFNSRHTASGWSVWINTYPGIRFSHTVRHFPPYFFLRFLTRWKQLASSSLGSSPRRNASSPASLPPSTCMTHHIRRTHLPSVNYCIIFCTYHIAE